MLSSISFTAFLRARIPAPHCAAAGPGNAPASAHRTRCVERTTLPAIDSYRLTAPALEPALTARAQWAVGNGATALRVMVSSAVRLPIVTTRREEVKPSAITERVRWPAGAVRQKRPLRSVSATTRTSAIITWARTIGCRSGSITCPHRIAGSPPAAGAVVDAGGGVGADSPALWVSVWMRSTGTTTVGSAASAPSAERSDGFRDPAWSGCVPGPGAGGGGSDTEGITGSGAGEAVGGAARLSPGTAADWGTGCSGTSLTVTAAGWGGNSVDPWGPNSRIITTIATASPLMTAPAPTAIETATGAARRGDVAPALTAAGIGRRIPAPAGAGARRGGGPTGRGGGDAGRGRDGRGTGGSGVGRMRSHSVA